MALRIKLTRIGKKNDPKYRIVVNEAKSRRDGKYVDQIGFYDPVGAKSVININKEKLALWLSRGVQFTKGTQRLLKKFVDTK